MGDLADPEVLINKTEQTKQDVVAEASKDKTDE